MSLNTILATAPLTTTNYILKATGTTIGNSLIFDNGTNVGIGNTNTSYTLDVSGTVRGTTSAYFATASGSVGIGTTSPSGKLHIYGKTYARYGSDDMFAFYYDDTYRFGLTNPSTDLRQLRVFGQAADGNSFIVLATGNDTERMRITSAGNVGIGTSSPNVSGQGADQRVLTIQGVGGVWGGVEVSLTGNTSAGALNGFYGFTNAGLSAGYKLVSYIGSWLDGGGVTSGADMRFHTQPNGGALAERMRITSAGNVGIGVVPTSAWGANSFALQLQGGALWSYNTLYLDLWQNSYYNGTNTIYQTTAEASYYRQYSGQHLWYTAPSGTAGTIATFTERMRITSGGYLYCNGVYAAAGSNAANVVVASDGQIYRSTSSLKYKTDILDYTKGLDEVLQLRPVFYKSINPNENGITYAGLIAEEVHELGLTEFVQYAEDGTPDALAYSNMIALLTKAIQEQNQTIQNLQEQINILAK
jgi:hypothetical protein